MKAQSDHMDYPLSLPLHRLAYLFNAFAFVVVNFCIYWARWVWISKNPEARPPTISWAISDPTVGPVFSIWITVSAVFLVVGIWILVWHHIGLLRRCHNPSRIVLLTVWIGAAAVFVLQPLSSLGMYWLSAFRLPFATSMHMTGSYVFFSAQAGVMLCYTVLNFVLLAESSSLRDLESQRLISRKWVRIRGLLGVASIMLIFTYLSLFIAKDTFTYPDYPAVYRAYVSVEPLVISSFLLVLLLSHVDMRRR